MALRGVVAVADRVVVAGRAVEPVDGVTVRVSGRAVTVAGRLVVAVPVEGRAVTVLGRLPTSVALVAGRAVVVAGRLVVLRVTDELTRLDPLLER